MGAHCVQVASHVRDFDMTTDEARPLLLLISYLTHLIAHDMAHCVVQCLV